METIFDFNPTKEEIERFACNRSKEDYIRYYYDYPYDILNDIIDLLYFRGDERYKHYLKLTDDASRNDFNRLILHT